MNTRYLPALLPAALGLAAWAVLRRLTDPIPVLSIRIDIGFLIFLVGFLISMLLFNVTASRKRTSLIHRAASEAERQKHTEAQRRFLRRLDHELKNPLTGIRAALANLEDPGTSAAPSALTEIRRQTERLARLTADLRKLADLEEIPLENQPVQVGTLLEEVVDSVRALPVGAGRDLRLVIPKMPWPLPEITGDIDLLNLAFFNLIENALKFSGTRDAVEVRAAEHGRQVQVEIADSGPGIPAEDLPRVFEELYRGSNARGYEGSGLGLALVRRVIERHGGSVTVRSRRDGARGTVFIVSLPVNS
jgi:two-component system OmpR family sensor kinase